MIKHNYYRGPRDLGRATLGKDKGDNLTEVFVGVRNYFILDSVVYLKAKKNLEIWR